MNMKAVISSLYILSIFTLGGCSTASKISKVIQDPNVPVGTYNTQPSTITIHGYGSTDMNQNDLGEAAPVVIHIYALTSTHRLYWNDFFTLTESEDAFGVTLKARLDEQVIKPDSYSVFGPYEIPEGTKYLGIVAELSDPDNSHWRSSLRIIDQGVNEDLLLLYLDNDTRFIRARF